MHFMVAGIYKKPTVKVLAKQLKAYKKLLKARGMSSKAVYRSKENAGSWNSCLQNKNILTRVRVLGL